MSGGHRRMRHAPRLTRIGTENILFAEAHESGHLAARLGVFQRAVKVHFGSGKNRRARAALTDHHRKAVGADHRGDFARRCEIRRCG